MYTDFVKSCTKEEALDQCQLFDEIPFSTSSTPLIGLLMANTCDIALKKAEYYTFCAVLPFDEKVFAHIKKKYSIDRNNPTSVPENKWNDITQFIHRLIGNQIPRDYWLGNIPSKSGYWCVDFQMMHTLNAEQMESRKEKKFAKLISPYKESAYVGFSNYLGRVGLPGESDQRKSLAKKLCENLRNNVPF